MKGTSSFVALLRERAKCFLPERAIRVIIGNTRLFSARLSLYTDFSPVWGLANEYAPASH